MKKGFVILGAIGISSVVMVTSGFAAMASTSGYSVYKDAIKATKGLDSVALSGSISLKDNGASLVNVTGSAKADLANETESGSATLDNNGKQQTIEVYRQSNQTITKSSASDVYYQEQERVDKHKAEKPESKQIPQEVENIIDSLVGNLQNSVTLDNKADGTKDITLSLTNVQLPPVVNAVGSLLIKNALNEKDSHKKQEEISGLDFKPTLPALTQNVRIDQIDIKANINQANFIQHQEASITISGLDASGASHQVLLQLNADLTGFNTTTPDTIDLTGKNVQVVQHTNKHNDNENEND